MYPLYKTKAIKKEQQPQIITLMPKEEIFTYFLQVYRNTTAFPLTSRARKIIKHILTSDKFLDALLLLKSVNKCRAYIKFFPNKTKNKGDIILYNGFKQNLSIEEQLLWLENNMQQIGLQIDTIDWEELTQLITEPVTAPLLDYLYNPSTDYDDKEEGVILIEDIPPKMYAPIFEEISLQDQFYPYKIRLHQIRNKIEKALNINDKQNFIKYSKLYNYLTGEMKE